MDATNQGSGAPADQSGAQIENGEHKGSDDSRGTASNPDLQRALDDLHRFKRESRANAERVNELTALLESEKKAKLREKEDWKTLAEAEAKRAQDAEEKAQRISKAYTHTQKYSTVHAAALKAGLRAEAEADLELLSLDDVNVEVTSEGRFIVNGHETFVEDLKKKRPHWFQTQGAPAFNGGGGRPAGSTGTEISYSDLIAIEKKSGRASKEYKEAAEKWAKGVIAKKTGTK